MNKIVQGVIVAVLLIAVAVGAWAVLTVPNAPEAATPAEAKEEKPSGNSSMSYEGNVIREEKGGKLIWEIKAETMNMDTATKNARMKNVEGIYHFSGGRVLTLKAGDGTYDSAKKEIVLQGNVAVEGSEGIKLQCKELHISGAEKTISAVGNATIVKDDMTGAGDKIESTDGFHIFKIIGNAKLTKGAIK